MRVKIVNARLTTEDMVEQKLAGPRGDRGRRRGRRPVRRLPRGDLPVGENRLRYNTFRWFTDPGGSAATFETSVYGRERDVEGLTDLLDKVSASVERVPS